MPRPRRTTRTRSTPAPANVTSYAHPESPAILRPEVGAQAHFKKTKPPHKYRYDDSLAPELVCDGRNPARELGEWLLAQIEEAAKLPTPHQFPQPREFRSGGATDIARVYGLADAVQQLRALSRPFLNWAGKAERLSFEVPTLPLFIHERLSTLAIKESLKGHRRDRQDDFLGSLFGPRRDLIEQSTRAYEYPDDWRNRLILGDSLVVMNSLLRFEGLGGQVQMVYMDPPYGVKFGSNFQPFVRKRDVRHGDDEDFTREPEMVQAYRDTWELGLHSYLTYLRDRLLLAKDLLSPSGSVFVQISDENLHHVRELMDEVFGAENFSAQIGFKAADPLGQKGIARVYDFILWYARDREHVRYHPVFRDRIISDDPEYRFIDDPSTKIGYRVMTDEEFAALPNYTGVFRRRNMTSSGFTESCTFDIELDGKRYPPPGRKSWSTNPAGVERLKAAGRIFVLGKDPYFKQYQTDFPHSQLENCWTDKPAARAKNYVVETAEKFVTRCMLMTTDPGDLVFDPTCGSGTTAFVAEQWGRRWITTDTSRVPLALARQRLLTATFDYYELKDDKRGPAGGFVYKRKQNNKGEEVGGIVPHITLKSVANNEPPAEEVLVDRPEKVSSITRVTGPFVVEATIPTAQSLDGTTPEPDADDPTDRMNHVDRMLEVLRRSPVVRTGGNQTVTLKNIRVPARTLALSAEAAVEAPSLHELGDAAEGTPTLVRQTRPVAIVFGPENGAITERLVREAWDEAGLKGYTHLYVIGFAIEPRAAQFIERCGQIGVPATYLAATMDLQMGDLLKHMRSSQIFSVCGRPDVALRRRDDGRYEVEMGGLNTFDPISMETRDLRGDNLPAWFLDTNYDGMCFHVCQAFFPRTGAWDNLKKALKTEFEPGVWEHLAGMLSAPFDEGSQGQIAVKVIDDRGNELIAVKKLTEAQAAS